MTTYSLRRVLPATVPLALHDAAASKTIERMEQSQLAPFSLMARAGDAVAGLSRAVAPHARKVVVLAGPGNNGGDGLVAAAALVRFGIKPSVHLIGDAGRLPTDAAQALQRARDSGCDICTEQPRQLDADLIVDALLGLGASRAPDGPVADAMAWAAGLRERQSTVILAVDLPTGLNPDTGQPWGDIVVRADHTLSLLTLKPGLFTGQGRTFCGQVWWDALGCGPHDQQASAWLTAGDGGASESARDGHQGHKGRYGDVVVVGGAQGMSGAALLAARAALSSGAGRVYLVALDPAATGIDTARPELMHRSLDLLRHPADWSAATVVAGCGAGQGIAAHLPVLLHQAPRLVLDADALNAIAAETALQSTLRSRHVRGRPTILTPHPLEAARLLATTTALVQADRVQAATELAEMMQCTVLLKGSGSVIASMDALPWINSTGNGRLATAGTGDVLAGWT
ncbi:MAG: NAD(P)H-hydrate dehydratase, partial [Aquabacterium sp.]